MCGIVGYIDRTKCANAAKMEQTILDMTRALSHRGPDSTGCWISDDYGVALGHTRLSIRDLSPAGNQPMTSRL